MTQALQIHAPPELRLVPPPAEEVVLSQDELYQLALHRGVFARLAEAAGSTQPADVEAHVEAILAAHAELPQLRARVAEFEARERASALDTLIRDAVSAGRCTPGIAARVRTAFDEGDITLKGAESWLGSLLPVKALDATKASLDAAPVDPSATRHTWQGKAWPDLTGEQRAELLRVDRQLYEHMRDEAHHG